MVGIFRWEKTEFYLALAYDYVCVTYNNWNHPVFYRIEGWFPCRKYKYEFPIPNERNGELLHINYIPYYTTSRFIFQTVYALQSSIFSRSKIDRHLFILKTHKQSYICVCFITLCLLYFIDKRNTYGKYIFGSSLIHKF